MKLDVRIAGRTRRVEVAREVSRWLVALDGSPVEADIVEVDTGIYSILLRGQSFEVRVHPALDGLRAHAWGQEFSVEVLDPRAWRGKRSGVLEAEGRQQIVAPMPGKIVRLLVKAGDAVEAGQGLLVVEAMKMQNEIRAPKTGVVERLHVAEGQNVNAGEVLAIVA